MRSLRYIPPGGSLVEVTSRTIQGRFLLDPDPDLNHVVLGVLGRAQRRYSMKICAFAFLSNHFHLLLDADDVHQLSRFMGYLNSNLAREVGRIANWQARFWATRYKAILVSNEEAAQVERLRYVLAQGTKEGLVSTPRDWQGAHCAHALIVGQPIEGLWIDRTGEYKARQRQHVVDPDPFRVVETVTLSPLPAWREVEPENLRARVVDLVTQIEDASRRLRFGRAVNDPRRSRHDRPPNLVRSPAPFCHAATTQARAEIRNAYRWFYKAFRTAAEKLARGCLNPDFPPGSFPPGLPFVRC